MVVYDKSYALGTNQGSSSRPSNQFIVIHDTGNAKNVGANSAANEASYMRGNWRNAYTHAIAGHDRVYIVGEPGYVAYGAGTPANEWAPFQIELARYSDRGLAIKAYQNYIAAIRDYAAKYSIPLTLDGAGHGVKTHKWVSDNLWGDHQDPYAYLASLGISKAQLAADIKNGVGNVVTTPTPQPAKPAPSKPAASSAKVNVYYSLRQLGGSWLGEVTNFGGGSNGYAGFPNHQHDLLSIRVTRGSLKYRVHVLNNGWQPWVANGNRNDTVNGCAGLPGHAIDGVQMIYITRTGESYQQAYYRSQTTKRAGWLGVCCDDGNSIKGYDSWAGMLGEPLDRLQINIGTGNQF